MERLPPVTKLPSVSRKLFREVAQEALNYTVEATPIPEALLPRVALEDNGKVRRFQFSDTPMLRQMTVFKSRFPGFVNSTAATMRFWALLEAVTSGKADEWVRVEGDVTAVEDVVFEAAAVVPLNKDGLFSRHELRSEIERLSQLG